MFQPEPVSFRGHFSMVNKPNYNFFKFLDIPREPRRSKEVKRTSLGFAEEKEVVVKSFTGSKYLLAVEDLIHERSHPNESEGETERKKIYFKKNTVDAFLPEMVAFFQYSNSNIMKDVYEDEQVIRRDDCLIESFGKDDLESSSELSNREMQDSMSSRQNESEDEWIEQRVCENLVAETKEIPDDFDHSEAKAVNQPQPVIDLQSTTDDKRESISEADRHEFSKTESNFQDEDEIGEIRKSQIDQGQFGLQESSATVSKTCTCQTEGKEPLQHCCNGSIRSTISHVSSHSFSFPVFPSEWIESPVRLPNSQRRKFRLHRRRRIRIFCWQF